MVTHWNLHAAHSKTSTLSTVFVGVRYALRLRHFGHETIVRSDFVITSGHVCKHETGGRLIDSAA